MSNLLDQLRGNINTVEGLLTDFFKCPEGKCTSNYLGLLQLATQELTQGAPIPPVMPSIVSNNFTAFGYPEISYYTKEVFWKTISDAPEYHKDTAFTQKMFTKLFEHTATGCSKADYTILSPGNIELIFEAGEMFDKTKDISSFSDSLITQFNLNNKYQARILYEYAKYIATDFATCDTKDWELSLRAQFFTQPIITGWQFLKDTLLQDLTTKIAVKTWTSDCEAVIKESAVGVTEAIAKKFCAAGNKWDEKNIATLIHYCMYTTNANFKTMMSPFGFSKIQAIQMCENNHDESQADATHSTGYMIAQIEQSLATQYKCQKLGGTACSRYELAAIQFVHSTVTLNPPTELGGDLKKSNTAKDWYPNSENFPAALEFEAVEPKLVRPKPDEALLLFHWDNLFAQALVVKAVGEARTGNMDWLTNKFYQTDLKVFESYMNKITISASFGGWTVKSKVSEFLFGYKSEVLSIAKATNPLLGGDPSIQDVVALSDRTTVVVQSRNTGKNDLSKVDEYMTINGLSTINAPMPFFNGKEVVSLNTNPW